jgi:hypothetical protein
MATTKRYLLESEEDWKNVEIPILNFKPEWDVRLSMPWAGAAARFYIDHVSVYYDIDGSLGCMYQPYWEVYSRRDEHSPYRYYADETAQLLIKIDEMLHLPEDEGVEEYD